MDDTEKPAIEQKPLKPSHYVGIGASAGGLEALEDLLKNVPVDTGMAFIVVQHLSPDYKSMMVELLQRRTEMPVLQIEDGMVAEANRIYLVPPKKNLEIYHGRLILTEQMRNIGINLPIDIFFRSLAADQKKNAIAIVLSGTGSDGTLGVRAVKEQGGMVMVQDYSSAKFDGMPKSAIATGLVDYILDTTRMSDALVKYVKHPLVQQSAKEKQQSKEETDYVKILSLIRTHIGEDFSYYKPKTLIRRIERRVSVNQFQTVAEYIHLLLHSPQECEILAKEFLIGVTQFFRDKEAFEVIDREIVPALFVNREPKSTVRIWSVGCSTGEEAYSIAILCKEYIDKQKLNIDLKIFATDLDREAVRFAGLAIYPESIVSDVPQPYLEKYFNRKPDAYQVNSELRQMVIFSSHNVITDPPFSKIDLIICRNLLIYFKPEMQDKVLGLFQYSLANQGYLFLGSSESINPESGAFEAIHSKWKIFRHKQGYKPPLPTSLLSPRSGQNIDLSLNTTVALQATDTVPWELNAKLYEKVINFFAPAGVIVDNNNTIVHLFKDMQRYLDFPQGKPSYDLLVLANPQLSMVLSNMLYKARKEKTQVVLRQFKYKEGKRTLLLNLSVMPVTLRKNYPEYAVVSIVEELKVENNVHERIEETFDFNEQAGERIKELERELQYRDENLQTTVEELETSNEELQATNEELVAANEELQSTNEELQSVNEELYTVNSQYQEKIMELTTLNNDISNLLTNTNIGTLFLDSNLTVRKFTREISKIVNVLDVDIGRPFVHLTLNCNYKNLYNDVNEVLDSLISKEIEIRADDGEWYLVKVQPYRHADKSIHGVLITQVNISALKRVTQINTRLNQAIEQSDTGFIITSLTGEIEYVNKGFVRMSGYSLEEVKGQTPRILKSGRHDAAFYATLWDTIRSGNTWKGELLNRRKDGALYWERAVITPHKDEAGQIINFLAIKDDITEKKKALEDLEKSEERFRTLFETMSLGVVYQNTDGEIISANPAAQRILGLTLDQMLGRTSIDPRWKAVRETGEPFPGEQHPAMEALRTGARVENVLMGVSNPLTERITWINVNATPLFKPGENKPFQVYATFDDITLRTEAEMALQKQGVEIQQQNEEIKTANEEIRQTNETLRQTVDELELSQKKYKLLFNTLTIGFAYHRIITDKKGKPIDYEFVKINKAFEQLTGLQRDKVLGKTVKHLMPDIEDFWIETYGQVALHNETCEFEHYSETLQKHFRVNAYSPEKGYFVTLFEEIRSN